MESSRRNMLATAVAMFLLLAVASMGPIRSYDYPWHLATGRWIVEHRALPLTDPFSVGSDDQTWHNGEWLFQAVAFSIVRLGGHEAIVLARALIVAAIFTGVFFVASSSAGPPIAMFLTALAWYGSRQRLDARPATLAAGFVVLALALLLAWQGKPRNRALLYGMLSLVWMNTHPSAVLAPALVIVYFLGRLTGEDARRREILAESALLAGASGAGLLINPWSLDGVLAPLRLISRIGEGEFVNAEWLPSMPSSFPLLYATMIAGAILFITRPKDRRFMGHAFLFVLFCWMAARHVRNQSLYFVAWPLLIAPMLPVSFRRPVQLAAAGGAVVFLLTFALQGRLQPALDPEIYPVRAVAELERLGLGGNIYNADQFGGYLEWTFYPERRVLIDGRNELHGTVMNEYARARLDGRLWDAFVEKYDLTLAVDEYHRETMSVVDAVTGETRAVPSSLIYFPRNRWALIAFDDVAMVFARRDAYPAALLDEIELRHLVPDDPSAATRLNERQRQIAARDLSRSIARFGAGGRTEMLAAALSR